MFHLRKMGTGFSGLTRTHYLQQLFTGTIGSLAAAKESKTLVGLHMFHLFAKSHGLLRRVNLACNSHFVTKKTPHTEKKQQHTPFFSRKGM